MKKVNLTQRIWLSFISLILLVGLLLVVVYPISVKSTLTAEMYRIIEKEQERYTAPSEYQPEADFNERRDAERLVMHLFLAKEYGRLQGEPVPFEVFIEMKDRAYKQMTDYGSYELTYDNSTLFYVVKKIDTYMGEVYHISYMWDSYRDQMVNQLWERLLYILILASLLSLIPAFWLKNYLRQPLTILGNHFEQIANRNWQEPFEWRGDQDFQKLSFQFEQMRQNLINYDKAQKTFIQHASHELKTPIMVVKSYAKSVKDGIFPQDNIEQAMDVIIEESNRMEKRVKDMLYYTKLDSIKEEIIHREEIIFGSIAYQLQERYRVQRNDLSFIIEGAEVTFYGDKEQVQILLENLVENALRYAQATITMKALIVNDTIEITVSNDGEHIPSKELRHIFTPFRKGNKGQFGLGLAIVKRIAELHGGYPTVINEENGVSFKIYLPL
ncbi:two-component sensor histidine kinase [Anaerobacillus alkalidiazotrophicus]|uniref:histidine kinase n=1 Tax=Anaerobacillus alkalidiazotrophicus TaxID=472963 RepID=A0A1S2M9S6_9BACI|nr:HAMP domain-containing sensor histidine kinase [Anaerobacillus alkalidiazotrophicus]OIJ21374.1 two-component sensor histidine kinase [Anaerobacillus alkalidiazotrophicus]